MSGLKLFRLIVWVAIALIGGILIGLTVFKPWKQEPVSLASSSGTAKVGGPFSLASHRGETIDNARLAGKPYLAFFGFTHCPDICPTTLSELSGLMEDLGKSADKLNVLFFTVDPERDTQDILAQYVSSFDDRILALRGGREETDAVVKAFAAYARKVPLEGDQYTMDHTAGVYLMGEDGQFIGTLDLHEPRETQLQKLRRLVGDDT